MNAKVLRVLEYDKVIHMLEQKATSDPGRQLCRDLVPMTDLAPVSYTHLLPTSECRNDASFNFSSVVMK